MDALGKGRLGSLGFPVSNWARCFEDNKTRDPFLLQALPLVVLARATGWAELESGVLQNHVTLEDGVGGPPVFVNNKIERALESFILLLFFHISVLLPPG